MATMHSSERIGEAWRLHRDGNHAEAIQAFKEIIQKAPDSVDAHYGMGLAYKAMNDNASAADAFQKSLSLAEEAYKAVRTTAGAEGHTGSNDLATNEDDRFMMLTRMLRQRMADVGVKSNKDEA